MQRRRSGGGGGGKHIVLPPPPPPKKNRQLEKLIICNARIGLKSTIMHYKTIIFNIKIPLNIHNFNFGGALRAHSLISRLCAQSASKIIEIFLTFAPPPHPKNGSTPLSTCTCSFPYPILHLHHCTFQIHWQV